MKDSHQAASSAGRSNPEFDEHGYAIFRLRGFVSPPILKLEPNDSSAKPLYATIKKVHSQGREFGVAIFKLSKEEYDNRFKKTPIHLSKLAGDELQDLKNLRIYQLDEEFRKWIDNGAATVFNDRSTAVPDTDHPFSLADYLTTGRCNELLPSFVYGDQSDLVQILPQWWTDRENSLLDQLRRDSFPKNLINGFQALIEAILQGITNRAPDDQNVSSIRSSLESAIMNLNAYAGQIPPSPIPVQPFAVSESNDAITQAFKESGKTYSHSVGYWMAVEIWKGVAGYASEHNPPTEYQATTATLYYNHSGHGKQGKLLWLTVELYRDHPGVLVPDPLCFGLTDFSKLFTPMNQCWDASGLASEFRGVWRLTSKYPGDDPLFKIDHRTYLPSLEGSSLQAAALAAMWAASGRIPLALPTPTGSTPSPEVARQYHEVDGKALRLLPHIAISAAIDWDIAKPGERDCSIRLRSILDDSIAPKIQALSHYSLSRKPEDSLFDSAIVVGSDIEKVRKDFSRTAESTPEYRGIVIRESCQTMGDALEWMLEVNTWKKAWNLMNQEEWEEQWGYAHDEDGRFLLRDGSGFITADESDARVILLDDMNHITMQGVAANTLTDDQRSALEARIRDLGINTGTWEYMLNPIGGAVERISTPARDSDDVLGG